MKEKGFAHILVLVIVIGIIVFFSPLPSYNSHRNCSPTDLCPKKITWQASLYQRIITPSVSDYFQEFTDQANENPNEDMSDWETYTNEELGFKFKYPNDYSIKLDGDKMFYQRYSIIPSEGFATSNKYNAPIPDYAIVAESREEYEGQYGPSRVYPFALWIFPNAENLSVKEWHQKYYYYPFQWSSPNPLPKKSVVNGIDVWTNSDNDNQLTYISKNNKIYLLYAEHTAQAQPTGKTIISTFEFTN